MDKWHDTKKYLDGIADCLVFVESKFKTEPEKVYIRKTEGGEFFEYSFDYNGYDCFIRVHKPNSGKNIGQRVAFNNETNTAYFTSSNIF